MVKMPIFPLNTVLFPGMPLSLYTSERKYQLMVEKCLKEQSHFGVVLNQEVIDSHSRQSKTHLIGCTAKIVSNKLLPDGRIHLVAVGVQRFQLFTLDHSGQFLIEDVDFLPHPQGEPENLHRLGGNLREWIIRYNEMLKRVELIHPQAFQLPHEPIMLAYIGAFILQINNQQKQALLEEQQAEALLESCLTHFRRELPLLPFIDRPKKLERDQGHLN